MSDAVATSQQGLAGKYPPYPEYKDSGLEWLGEIPAHWNISRIKYVAQLNPSKSEVRGLSDDTIVSFIPMEAIGERGEIDVSRTRLLGDVLTGYSYITDGDVILAKITPCFENGKGAVVHGLENGIGFATTEVIPARPYRKCDAQFLYYLFTSNPFKALAEGSMYGAGGQKRVADSFVAEYHFAEAPTDERENIAAFLDYETARIDRLIAQQQRLIELLKEKRQAVISHAVTKGLNPNAPMKESGVEWLGQVPEHWVISPLKYKCVFSGGGTPSKDNLEYWNGSIPWVSPKDMKSFWITDAEDKITEQAIKESSTKLVQPGAVLMVVRSGILQRTIPVGMNTIPVTMNQDMKAIRFSSAVYAEWLSFFIKGYEDSLLLDWRKQGATVESIEHEYLANSLMLFPPEEEARSIIAALGRRLDKFDQLEQRASDAITLLQERRTALISAAVTGKIDLRGWTQPAEEVAA